MIDFACISCGQVFRVKDGWAGKHARCKKCGSAIEIPGGVEPASDRKLQSEPRPHSAARNWSRMVKLARWAAAEGYLWYALPGFMLVPMLIGVSLIIFIHDRDYTGQAWGHCLLWGSVLVAIKMLKMAQQHQVRCPACSERIQAAARVCRHCGSLFTTYSAIPTVQRARSEMASVSATESEGVGSFAFTLGILLLLGGLAVATYYFAAFDVSVTTDDGDRIVNLKKMSDRQSGMIFGVAVAVVGGLVAATGNRAGTATGTGGRSSSARKAIVLFILGLALWLAGHFLTSMAQR